MTQSCCILAMLLCIVSISEGVRTAGWKWDCAIDSEPIPRPANSSTFCSDIHPEQTCCFGPLAQLEVEIGKGFHSLMAKEGTLRGLFNEPSCEKFIKQTMCTACAPGSEEYLQVSGTVGDKFHVDLKYCNEYCFQFEERCGKTIHHVCGKNNHRCVWLACEHLLETIRLAYPRYVWPGDGITFHESGSVCYHAPNPASDKQLQLHVTLLLAFISAAANMLTGMLHVPTSSLANKQAPASGIFPRPSMQG